MDSPNSSPKYLSQSQEIITTVREEKRNKKMEDFSKHTNIKSPNTPGKISKNTILNTNNVLLTPRIGSSPKNSTQSSPGSVLSKASLFESKNTEAKVKDPIQMTLSERMALFEKNKGEAPLLPKAPLTMSIPPKKLHEKDKSNSSTYVNNTGIFYVINTKIWIIVTKK